MQLNDSLQKFSSAELLEAYIGRAKESQALAQQFPTKHRNLLQFYLLPALPNHDRDFYRWDRSIFQYQTMCKSSVILALFIKHSSLKWRETNKHTKLCCFPGKTNCIHCTHDSRFFGKLNKVIFPSQPKTHFFGDILLKQVLCSTAVDIDVSSSGIEENCPYKEFCLSWHLEGPWSKKTFPKSILHRKALSYVQNVFNSFILTMFSKTIQLFNSLNNSEYMKWY